MREQEEKESFCFLSGGVPTTTIWEMVIVTRVSIIATGCHIALVNKLVDKL